MSKTDKKRHPKLEPREKAYTMMPWSCNHHPTFSEIEAYIPITGEWEIIADIHDTKGVDAEVVAGLVARAVNSYEKQRVIIEEMAAALELCLACGAGLTSEAEHQAQVTLKRGREMLI